MGLHIIVTILEDKPDGIKNPQFPVSAEMLCRSDSRPTYDSVCGWIFHIFQL